MAEDAENIVGNATTDNINRLARVLQSEASVGNDNERNAVGWTVLNRMSRNNTNSVSDVDHQYNRRQAPTQTMRDLAGSLLRGEIPDPTNGATHYYSPRTMPQEGEETTGYDVGGGLEQVDGLQQRNYRPSWSTTFQNSNVPGVRPRYYRFYRVPGNNPVR